MSLSIKASVRKEVVREGVRGNALKEKSMPETGQE